MTQGLNINWPSTDLGTETGRDCCLCSFPNKHSHIPNSRSSPAGYRGTQERHSGKWTSIRLAKCLGCQLLPGQRRDGP
ncbi:hypothetical protein QQF64_034967 [Cirrhinus molitorella]|uniref:Uncharacterized protein n=1 Tax=Cirrhinus molitorella TaxID=172907 RepID=A0ABR3NEI2_9TELE